MPELTVVVVNHDRRELLVACLDALREAVAPVDDLVDVVVVDNASRDGSAAAARALLPQATVVETGRNGGFAFAVNEVVLRAPGFPLAPWFVTLDSDTVAAADAVVAVLEHLRRVDGRVGSIALQMRFAAARDTINSAGLEVDCLGVARDRLVGAPVGRSEREPTRVFGASSGAAAFRTTAYRAVGGLDERFFYPLEDVDLAWRLRMAGWAAEYVPDAVVYHRHGGTVGRNSAFKHYQVGRNRVLVLAKNATRGQLVRYGALILAYEAAHAAYATAAGATTAPLRGRVSGLREWRRFRRESAGRRRRVTFTSRPELVGAIRRRRTWQRVGRAEC